MICEKRIVHVSDIQEIIIKIFNEFTKLYEKADQEIGKEPPKKLIQVFYKCQIFKGDTTCFRVTVSCMDLANVDVKKLLDAVFAETALLTIPLINEVAHVFSEGTASDDKINGVLQKGIYEGDEIILVPSKNDDSLKGPDRSTRGHTKLQIKLFHIFHHRHVYKFDEFIFPEVHRRGILHPDIEFQIKRMDKIIRYEDYTRTWFLTDNLISAVRSSENQILRETILNIYQVENEKYLKNVLLEHWLHQLQ